MSVFFYTGSYVDNGVAANGKEEGDSRADVIDALEKRGIEITDLRELGSVESPWTTFEARVREMLTEGSVQKARQAFWQVLLTVVRRGGSIDAAVTQYMPECGSPRFAATLNRLLHERSKEGDAFGSILARLPDFPVDQVEMVRAAERSGSGLVSALDHIVQYDRQTRRQRARDGMSRIWSYISLATSGLSTLYIAYVYAPKMAGILKQYTTNTRGGDLPPAVADVAAFGHFMTSIWGVFVICTILFLARYWWRVALEHLPFARWVERWSWRLTPMLKEYTLKESRARALHQIVHQRGSGVDEVKVFELIGPTIKCIHFREALARQAHRLDKGDCTFSESFLAEPMWGAEVGALVSGVDESAILAVFEGLAGDLDEEVAFGASALGAAKSTGTLLLSGLGAAFILGTIYLGSFAMYLIIQSRMP